MGINNKHMNEAKKVKNDEFYTTYEDIEAEVSIYKDQFYNKNVFLPCDDNNTSMFVTFFLAKALTWGIKKVIVTSINSSQIITYDMRDFTTKYKETNKPGDFRRWTKIPKNTIVVTNPPFSLARDFLTTLIEKWDCKFLFIGNMNLWGYKEMFKYFKDGKFWVGKNQPKYFNKPDGSVAKLGICLWYTNLKKINDDKAPTWLLATNYQLHTFEKYDNYDAINVNNCNQIPGDYFGNIGVPISYIRKPIKGYKILHVVNTPKIKGKYIFKRAIIRKERGWE